MTCHTPETEDQVRECVRAALSGKRKLEIRGGGTKAIVGTPDRQAEILATGRLDGIIDYDPAELVMTVRPGTSLAEVQEAAAKAKQHLAFEPYGDAGATIGGIVAAGISGSRRVSAGAVRDHVLGFRAVSGRGDIFQAGGKVVKNVTGYDLSKLMAGSWGRLAVLTEITLKVVPASPQSTTLAWAGIDAGTAWPMMARAMGLPADVAATAFCPAQGGREALTLVRLEGFQPSIEARQAILVEAFRHLGIPRVLAADEARAQWHALRSGANLTGEAPLWRVSLPARSGLDFAKTISELGGDWLADWAGGLLWVRLVGHADLLRRKVREAGGHAMLVAAPKAVRRRIPALDIPVPALAALNARVRQSFDPDGIFETGRFLDRSTDEAHANTV